MTGERPWYRWYVLSLLVAVYALSYIDRQIVTVLAPYLKAEFAIGDAQLGILYGTTFALFYGLFGIPLARLADGWSRVRTLALGLCFWSVMTALSGMAGSFALLALARVGVGVGEASSTPAAVSLLGDYFERSRRATVLGLYSVGVYIGSGVSLIIGGSVVAYWQTQYRSSASAPLGLAGWQAAFITVGIPGLFLAVLILLTVREPDRGRLDRVTAPGDPRPFRSALRDLAIMVPPFNLIRMANERRPRREIAKNLSWLVLAILFCIAVVTWTDSLLSAERRVVLTEVGGIRVTGNVVQWVAMSFAFYAVASWFQSVRLRDAEAARMLTASRTFRAVTLAGGFLAFAMNATTGFVFVYANRYLGFTAADALRLGFTAAVAGGLGITISGYVADIARRIIPTGRLLFVCLTASCHTAASVVQFTTSSQTVFYVAFAVATFFVPMWFAPNQATTQDLVTPRLRGTAFAMYSLGANILGLGIGPYTVGLISDATGDLRTAILCALGALPLAVVTLLYAARNLEEDEAVTAATMAAAGA